MNSQSNKSLTPADNVSLRDDYFINNWPISHSNGRKNEN